jgi:hypothetical protein
LDLSVDTRVVMAEEAHAGSRAREELIEPGGSADEAWTLPVPLEANSRRCIMRQHDVDARAPRERIDLVARVVTLRVALQIPGWPIEVRRAMAAPDATDAQRTGTFAELEAQAVLEIVQTGQNLVARLVVQPYEVLVVSLDEQRPARRPTLLADPERKITCTVVPTSGAVDAIGIGSPGAPGRIRTCDPRIRSPTLYPAELRARTGIPC